MKFFLLLVILFVLLVLVLLFAFSPALKKSEAEPKIHLFFESQPKEVKRSTLKIVTWNIGYASGLKNNQGSVLSKEEIQNNLNLIAEEIQKLSPDVIFLQEVDFLATRSHGLNQFTFLAEALKMPFGASLVLWNKNYVPYPYWPVSAHFKKLVSGQAVLSRYPLSDLEVKIFDKPKNPFWYNWFYPERALQKLTLHATFAPITIWNVHHEAFEANARYEQAQALLESVKEASALAPHQILAGDFNDPNLDPKLSLKNKPEASTFEVLENLTSLKSDRQIFKEEAFTFPSDAPFEKLDHLLASQNFEWINRKVICTKASDHCLVYVELKTKEVLE